MTAETRIIDVHPAPEPLPESLPPVPEFPAALLPDSMRGWIGDIAERMQCPADFPAVAAMVALSIVVGRQVGFRPKARDSWTVTPNLWGAIIARPGQLKTPALSEALKPLHRLEALARDEHSQAMSAYQVDRMLAEARAKQAAKDIAAALKKGDRGAAHDHAEGMQADAPDEPERRRYVTSDPTVEKLGELLAANPRGLLVFRDELIGWMQGLEREGRESSRAFYLEAWAGDGSFTVDRIGRGTLDIPACCVSVLGGITPGPLGAYLDQARRGGLGDDGLMQRFQLVAWPDASGEWRNVDRWPDTTAKRAAWETFERLDKLDARGIGAELDDEGRPFLRADGGALEMFTEWRCDLEARLRSGDDPDVLVSHLAKFRSLVPSLALICQLADDTAGPVSAAAMARALAWSQYLEAHARRMYHAAALPELGAAQALLKHLERGDLGAEFTARDVQRRGWSRLTDRAVLQNALELLADHAYLAAHEIGPGETGGRPSVVYRVNPRAAR
jgi:hypothetical protein